METSESFGHVEADNPHPPPASGDDGTKEALVSAAEDAGAAVEQLYRAGNAFIGREAQDRPYLVVGVAAGIGFILGGGLAWRMAGGLANLAGRIAVTRALEDWVSAAVRKASDFDSSLAGSDHE